MQQKFTFADFSILRNMVKTESREKEIYKVTIIGSIVNFIMVLLKFIAAVAGKSSAMLADAVHSLSDFITAVNDRDARLDKQICMEHQYLLHCTRHFFLILFINCRFQTAQRCCCAA